MITVYPFLSDPLGDRVPVKFRPTGTNMYSIDWIPVLAGTYDLDVTYGNVIPVWGSPMKIKVYDSAKVRLLTTNDRPVVGERYVVKGNLTYEPSLSKMDTSLFEFGQVH